MRSVPTFIFTVVAPGYQLSIFSISARSSTSGMVALIGISLRSMGKGRANAASIPLISQGRDSFSSYSRNGENSAQPDGPSKSAISLSVMPRNFVRVGIEITFSDERTSLRICSDMSVKDVWEICRSLAVAFLYKRFVLLDPLRLNRKEALHRQPIVERLLIRHRLHLNRL